MSYVHGQIYVLNINALQILQRQLFINKLLDIFLFLVVGQAIDLDGKIWLLDLLKIYIRRYSVDLSSPDYDWCNEN